VDLFEAATRIRAIALTGSVRKASESLRVPRSTLYYWLDRMMLTLPLDGKSAGVDSDGIPQILEP
ncbi:MAG TPA: hypothetical protein PKU97_24900, partial [Kofleriaceae bacterium]|nr:hypothetical protein [Kofleriaceae bacterium]